MSDYNFIPWGERHAIYTNWVEFIERVVIPLHWPEVANPSPEQRNHAWDCWMSEPEEYKWAVMMMAWARAFPEKVEMLKEVDREGSPERG